MLDIRMKAIGVVYFVIATQVVAFPALAQMRNKPELIVQESDPYFTILAGHQAQIRNLYDEGRLKLPSFGDWIRVESKSASLLFPKLLFCSISWSEVLHPDAKLENVTRAFGLEKTVGINTDKGELEAELFCCGNYEAFGKLLVKYRIIMQSPADARRVWEAFCDIHHRHWQEYPFEKISDTTWHLGIFSYDQTVGATDDIRTVETVTHYMQVMVDRGSGRILSWESKVDRANRRTLPKE